MKGQLETMQMDQYKKECSDLAFLGPLVETPSEDAKAQLTQAQVLGWPKKAKEP